MTRQRSPTYQSDLGSFECLPSSRHPRGSPTSTGTCFRVLRRARRHARVCTTSIIRSYSFFSDVAERRSQVDGTTYQPTSIMGWGESEAPLFDSMMWLRQVRIIKTPTCLYHRLGVSVTVSVSISVYPPSTVQTSNFKQIPQPPPSRRTH